MVQVEEVVRLLGEKEIRLYELNRDNVNLQTEINTLKKKLEEMICKSSELKAVPPLPFPVKEVEQVEEKQVD